MSIGSITTGSQWLQPSNITATLTGNVTGTVTGSSTLNVLKAGDTMTGTLNGPSVNVSTIEVGETNSANGITFINNIAGNIPANLNCYTELTDNVTWTSDIGTQVAGIVYLRRIGRMVSVTLGSWNMSTGDGAVSYSSTAINSFYRPGGAIQYVCAISFNGVTKEATCKINSNGVIEIFSFTGSSSGAINGLTTSFACTYSE